MDLISLILLGVGLAMDAFAVAVCGGIVLPTHLRTQGAWKFGLWFGIFQGLMPIIGWGIGSYFTQYITEYDHWIAFALLGYIGVNMIIEAHDSCSLVGRDYGTKQMLILALATSIDALAVGISFSFLAVDIWLAASIIAGITFVMAFLGCLGGNSIGELGRVQAETAGGVVLIVLGCKILAEHMGWL